MSYVQRKGLEPERSPRRSPFSITDLSQRLAALVRRLWRYGAAGLAVCAATPLAEAFYRILHTTRLSMLLLAPVLFAAVRLGRGPAIFAALLAAAAYDFYLAKPRGGVSINDPEALVALTMFLAVALLTGGLAGRLRDQREAAQASERRLSVLFEATKELSEAAHESLVRERLAGILRRVINGPAWVIGRLDGPTPSSLNGLPREEAEMLQRLASIARMSASSGETLGHGPWRARGLVVDGHLLGAALWREPKGPPARAAETEALLAALCEVGAGAVARARLEVEKAEAVAMARTGERAAGFTSPS